MTLEEGFIEAGPRLDRDVRLEMRGDWGTTNFHKVCGWLARGIRDRSGPGSQVGIWQGEGMSDNLRAVIDREVDISLVVPALFARMAADGTEWFEGDPHPELRGLGTIPQNDRLVLAISAEHGIRTFADWREKQAGLRIATSPNDGVHSVGLAVHAVMAAHGIPSDLFRQWGGEFVEHGRSGASQALMRDGAVDAVFHEAVFADVWQELGHQRDAVFIPMEDEALTEIEKKFGWRRATLPAGYFPGMDTELTTLEFSDFLLFCRDDLPEDVAYLVAWLLVETRDVLERQYHHIPPEKSGVTYPLEPDKIADTALPLHPGAARFYDEYFSR